MKLPKRNAFFYGALFSFLFIFWLCYRFEVRYTFPSSYVPLKSFPSRLNFDRVRKEAPDATEPKENVIDEKCKCISEKSKQAYDFCYKNPKKPSLIGLPFNCTFLSTLEDLKILGDQEQSLVDIEKSERNESDVIYVTAISANHLGNFREAYTLLKKHWPNQKVLVYSLDLDASKIRSLEEDPNITVRKFDYSKYPSYVKNWMEYRFKAIILAEAIRDYSNVWWIDAHTRWLRPKPLDQFYGEVASCFKDPDCDKQSSLMMFINSTHSNYAVLTTGLLDYFPTFGLDTLKTNEKGLQLSAMFVYLARTPFTLEILKWHTLCALEEKCMNPPKAKLKCDIIPRWGDYAGCFRYDQSSINILMFNAFRDHNHYFMNVGELSRTYAHY